MLFASLYASVELFLTFGEVRMPKADGVFAFRHFAKVIHIELHK